MKLIFLTLILVAALSVAYCVISSSLKDTYVTEVVINRPYDDVWTWISDPTKYAKLYPNWVKHVEKKSETIFQIDDQFGHSNEASLKAIKESGTIDLQIGSELSRLRIYPLDENRTAIVHLAKRWKNATFIIWFFHRRTTDKDFENAKQVIETEKTN